MEKNHAYRRVFMDSSRAIADKYYNQSNLIKEIEVIDSEVASAFALTHIVLGYGESVCIMAEALADICEDNGVYDDSIVKVKPEHCIPELLNKVVSLNKKKELCLELFSEILCSKVLKNKDKLKPIYASCVWY